MYAIYIYIYMVTWIPSIYPLYVSIYIPAPWILWVYIYIYCIVTPGYSIYEPQSVIHPGEPSCSSSATNGQEVSGLHLAARPKCHPDQANRLTPTVRSPTSVDTLNEGMISMHQPEFGSYAIFVWLYGQI